MNFKEYQPYLSPTFIQEDYYKRSQQEIFGQEKDDIVDSAKNAIKQGLIQFADNDALLSLGNNFDIDKSPYSSFEYFRQKLGQAWVYWQTSGTPARLISEIKEQGFANVYILPQYIEAPPGVFTKTLPNVIDVNNAGTQWAPRSMEEQGNFWSNFWIVIDQPHDYVARKWGNFTTSGKWGTGTNSQGYVWGSVFGDPVLLAYLKSLIKKLKPAWTSCRGIVFLFGATKVWAEPNWGDGTLWGWGPNDYAIERMLENWEEPSI